MSDLTPSPSHSPKESMMHNAMPIPDGVPSSLPALGRPHLRIALAIATAGRPACVAELLARIAGQSRPPDGIVVCGASEADVTGIAERFPTVRILVGRRGLAAQRNTILDALEDYDVAQFLDDDFVPAPGYVAAVAAVLQADTDVVMTTGHVLHDGIRGPGYDFAFADAAIAADTALGMQAAGVEDVYTGYGCNMAVRLATVRRHRLVFDEQLPLYAWLEDVDFSRQIARHGRIVRVGASRGVHLGIKLGRQSGVRLGYSQIANPIHLMRKGTCSYRKALYLMSRNVAANLSRCLRPEPYVDRLGRCLGNLRGALDLLTGRLNPLRILGLDATVGGGR